MATMSRGRRIFLSELPPCLRLPVNFRIFFESAMYSQRFSDAASGYGGKYGVQVDRKDKSAAGWDERSELTKHESQMGK